MNLNVYSLAELPRIPSLPRSTCRLQYQAKTGNVQIKSISFQIAEHASIWDDGGSLTWRRCAKRFGETVLAIGISCHRYMVYKTIVHCTIVYVRDRVEAVRAPPAGRAQQACRLSSGRSSRSWNWNLPFFRCSMYALGA